MSSTSVTFNGYRATSEGIAVWPRRRPKHRWSDLRTVTTAYQADHKRYTTLFVFADGRRLRLGASRFYSFGSSLGRFAENLALALAHAPASIEADPLTRDLARWGPRAVRTDLKRTPERFRSAADWIALARHHRAWMEVKKALKAVDHALIVQSDHHEALRLRFDLLAWSGARRVRLLEAAERWLAVYPKDDDARSLHLQLRLQKPDAVAAQEAEDWLVRRPDRADLTVALAAHHFRARNYERAAARWVTFAEATTDEAARRAALENEAFVRRFAATRGLPADLEVSDTPAQTFLWQQRAAYPPMLRRQGVTGQAEIAFRVDEDGFTRDVRIVSATHVQFGAAAYFAVAQWGFDPRRREPWTRNDVIKVPVHFSLTN